MTARVAVKKKPGPKPKKRPSFPSSGVVKTAEIKALKEDNERLRELVGLPRQEPDVRSWGQFMSQEMRDHYASLALMREWGHALNALRRLRFDVSMEDIHKSWYKQLVKDVFETPGCIANMKLSFADAQASWDKIIERQREIALTGDADQAVRAAQMLARVEGRIREPAPPPPVLPAVSLHVLVNGTNTDGKTAEQLVTVTHDPLALLSHEPGEPMPVESPDEIT